MMAYADFEIGLHRRAENTYSMEIRFSESGGDVDIRQGAPAVMFDIGRLLKELNKPEYGKYLAKYLFSDTKVKDIFVQARASASSKNMPLRLRLYIGPTAAELHGLRWETLQDPDDGSSLVMSEQILFSRYLCSFDWRPIRRCPKSDLRALIVVANPTDIDSYKLARLDVDGEISRAKSALGCIHTKELASGGSASIDQLFANLRDGFDIVYLVCHGRLLTNEPQIYLEKEDGSTGVVMGSDIIGRLNELRLLPRLIVLASCQSAGSGDSSSTGDKGILAALGPRLAEAGIPAVLAMQDNISINTLTRFMPVFFQELQRDGQIDRAMAVARGTVRERFDSSVPVLFMRLKSGQIWYVPGFADDRKSLETWPSLINSISNSRCTPILGPGLMEPFLGSRREIAQRWAEEFHYPLSPHEREDLPQVAQYLVTSQDRALAEDTLLKYLSRELMQRYQSMLPSDLCHASLDEKIGRAGMYCMDTNSVEPHLILAKLQLPIYITTDPSSLLTKALICAGKKPKVDFCRWNDDLTDLSKYPSVFGEGSKYRPTNEEPLVFHLFGCLDNPDSVVLTEDDYFDYLIGVTKNNDLIPPVVRNSLNNSALLFLGFQLDDWNFRVLYRSLMRAEGRKRRDKYKHVAAQIEPEEGRIMEPEGARLYLEKYFQEAYISVFWGSPEEFVRELRDRL
jgi:hypothetical protein